jgi:hypothetical protein
MQPGVRCAAAAILHKRKDNNEVPLPFTSPQQVPISKGILPVPVG